MALISMYLIIFSVINYFNVKWLPNFNDNEISLVNFILSMFLLVVSLLETSKNRIKEADELHKNAKLLRHVYRKIALEEDPENIIALENEYHASIDKCEYNHDGIDYRKAIYQNTHVCGCKRAKAFLQYFTGTLFQNIMHISFILLPPIFFILYLIYSTPSS